MLGIFTRSIERGGIRVAETGDVIARDFDGAAVKIVKAEFAAEFNDVGFRFVIAGQDIHAIGVFCEDRAESLEAAPPVDEIAVGKIVIRFDGHQFFEGGLVAVDIGEDEELHFQKISRRGKRIESRRV